MNKNLIESQNMINRYLYKWLSFEKWNHNYDIAIFIINTVNMIKQNKYYLYFTYNK